MIVPLVALEVQLVALEVQLVALEVLALEPPLQRLTMPLCCRCLRNKRSVWQRS